MLPRRGALGALMSSTHGVRMFTTTRVRWLQVSQKTNPDCVDHQATATPTSSYPITLTLLWPKNN